MKRWGIAAAVVLLGIFCALNRTAMDPADFTGDWYSSYEQCRSEEPRLNSSH